MSTDLYHAEKNGLYRFKVNKITPLLRRTYKHLRKNIGLPPEAAGWICTGICLSDPTQGSAYAEPERRYTTTDDR